MERTPPTTHVSIDDFDRCYRAVESKDARFDGWFITGVLSTGIYCRPSCPTPVRPHRKNVQFFPTSAAAQSAGLRACKRCRPDASPGSPEWDLRADLAGRAMRLIADGLVDREGVAGLASGLAVSERTLHRVLQKEVGASPIALARAQRAQASRVLIETTDMKFSDIAFAAGFSSIRQFNDTVREVFALTPSQLRSRPNGKSGAMTSGAIGLRLPFRHPFRAEPLLSWIAGHSPDLLARVEDGTVRRTLRLPNGPGLVAITPRADHVWCDFSLAAFADLSVAVSRVRRLLDLDADPMSVGECLTNTPLGEIVHADPGLRVPGTVDGFEQAITTIVGQQVSVAAGRTFGSRIVERFGDPVSVVENGGSDTSVFGDHHEWRLFPTAEALAEADLAPTGLTGARQRTITGLAKAVIDGRLDLTAGADRAQTRLDLLALDGIGPWTADIIAMRALGDPDVFPVGDLVLRKAAANIGLPGDAKELTREAAAWSPWRSYAAHHLWASIYPMPAGSTPKDQ